jgi:iron complex transport system substrate-binding protein
MSKRFFIILLISLLPIIANAQPRIFHDAASYEFKLNKPARRIISLAPNLTEIIFAAGAGKYLVGVSSFSDYPPEAKKLPIVANFNNLDMEKIVNLHPDLVIAWQGGNQLKQLNRLRKLGIPVYIASFCKITDIPKNMLVVGELAGTDKVANEAANKFTQTYLYLKHNYLRKKPVTVFYELSLQPLMTLNERSLVGQVIDLCGGRNIFAATSTLAPHVNLANVLAADPQLIFVSDQAGTGDNAIKIWNDYRQLTATKKHHVFVVDSNMLERYGPRILQGAKTVCAYIDLVRRDDKARYAWHVHDLSEFFSSARKSG